MIYFVLFYHKSAQNATGFEKIIKINAARVLSFMRKRRFAADETRDRTARP
jgi:hypothetical protein